MDFERFLCTKCYGVESPCNLLVKRANIEDESTPVRCPFSEEYVPAWRKVV